jgi:hypothetical protein
MSYQELVAALKGALRNFSRSDLLTRSPLLRSRRLARRAKASPIDRQSLLTRAADALFTRPHDERLRRVLELSYFRPAAKQGLSISSAWSNGFSDFSCASLQLGGPEPGEA